MRRRHDDTQTITDPFKASMTRICKSWTVASESSKKNQPRDGSQSMPEVISCVKGKPDIAGGPVINTL